MYIVKVWLTETTAVTGTRAVTDNNLNNNNNLMRIYSNAISFLVWSETKNKIL